MAAWLAYLKSRLLLPQPPQDEEPSGAELAAQLEHRLRLLEAMQIAGTIAMAHASPAHAEPQRESGGGNFGGAGASGTY